MRRMWPGGSRPSPGRFDPTWEEIACAAVDVGGARREKKSAYLCRMCAPMRSSFHNFVTHSFTHNFHTYHLSHAPSFTHNFATHSLSHTTFTHTIFLCHTPSFTYNFVTHILLVDPSTPPSSFLPSSSRYNLEEVDLWGYPVL